jgi:hypothetical protein
VVESIGKLYAEWAGHDGGTITGMMLLC